MVFANSWSWLISTWPHAHGQHLFQLELHCTTNAVNLLCDILTMLQKSWELAKLVHSWPQKTRDLLHDGLRCQEKVVCVCKLLHFLLVLVKGLQSLDIHAWDACGLGSLDVLCISENAARHTRAWNVGQLDGTGETLVLLRVVVLQDNLELNGL